MKEKYTLSSRVLPIFPSLYKKIKNVHISENLLQGLTLSGDGV
jgi:hypothetical protein